MTATFDLSDTQEVVFTLEGNDAKGASVPLEAGVTAAWSLADPDSSGAVLTVSADTLSATVSAGVPDTVYNAATGGLTASQVAALNSSLAQSITQAGGSPADVQAAINEQNSYIQNYPPSYGSAFLNTWAKTATDAAGGDPFSMIAAGG